MKTLLIRAVDVAQTDLTPLRSFVPDQYHHFFLAGPGVGPYRLLAYLSTQFNDQTLVEVGVHNGWGSMCLAANPHNRVVGYDIDLSTFNLSIGASHPNLTVKEGLAHEMDPDLLLAAPLIHFDALHDGVYEQVFFDWLVSRGYEGILVLDDIHLNPAMQRFWAGITLPKHDLTRLGHSTGTGFVCFGDTSVQIT